MSSLADLPELVGFFSYSRRDDESSEGALSRLRTRLYSELRIQLGRDFRLWQDTAAIPDGALWEDEIKRAIAESVFFIPIVTPSAVASTHCRFEFESFLEREGALGRDNLIFPLLYVRVPAFEKEDQWRRDEVLKIIGARQYVNWQDFRHRDPTEPEVARKIEQYCGNIVETLRQPWVSRGERSRRGEVKGQAKANEPPQRAAQAEAKRRAGEQEQRQPAAPAAREEAEREHLRQEVEAKRHVNHEARRRSGARVVPRRTALAGAASTVAFGLSGSAYMLWPRVLPPTPKFAGTRRTALVIGNAQYRTIPPLDNPVRDAQSVSAALEQRGFRVMRVLDADGRQTIEAITDFERTLSVVGGVGIFYYAGRAAYIDGEDILMPVDVKLDSTKTKLEGGVNLTTVQTQVQAKTTPKFVSDGSAVIYSASKGEYAEDGPAGQHSPFTTAFLEALTHDEDELGDLFRRVRQTMDKEPIEPNKKQTPYFEDSRTVKFQFNRPESDAAIGALKILIFDSCRDNPLKLSVAGR
jgi:hypothetical protein